MKAILEFNLPEEKDDHDMALNGYKYKIAVGDIFDVLRKYSKYDDSLTTEQYTLIDELRTKFNEILNDLDINE